MTSLIEAGLVGTALAILFACAGVSADEGARPPEPKEAQVQWTSEALQLSAIATVREDAYYLRRGLGSGGRTAPSDQPDRVPTFYPGEPIFVRVETTNLSQKAKYFTTTEFLWQLDVVDAQGRQSPLNAYGQWARSPAGIRALKWNPRGANVASGQFLAQLYDVTLMHDLSLPGRYLIRFSRTDPGGTEAGEPVSVVSPPLEVEVADIASAWRTVAEITWADNWVTRMDSAQIVKNLARFIAEKLYQSAVSDPSERVRDTALSELKELGDELDEMVKRAETNRPSAAKAEPEPAFLRELSAPGPVWPEPTGGGPAVLQRSQQRTAALTSFRFSADVRKRNGSVANGEFVRWGPDLPGTVAQSQRGQWHLRSRTTHVLHRVVAPGGLRTGAVSELLVFTPRLGWIYSEPENEAARIDGARLLSVVGVAQARRKLLELRLAADVVAWLMLMDPKTAKVVDTKTVSTAGGNAETLHVIEGKPVAWLLPNAHRFHRDDLPIEPLVRITVGEDGFPRHVLVQRYAPSSAVLELTVTDYELNPDLPDDLFEFKPPEGVEVIEADPSMWK